MKTRLSRRRLLGALPAVALAGVGIGTSRPAGALDAGATAALLKARLREQGVGLSAVRIDGTST